MSPGQKTSIHPDEDMLELYALGRLPERLTAPVRRHVHMCAWCGRRLSRAQDFIAAITGALTAAKSRRGLLFMPRRKD